MVHSGIRHFGAACAVLLTAGMMLLTGCGSDGSDGGTFPNPGEVIGNRAPQAGGGPDRSVTVGEEVRLDGSSSTDPDGDPLTFDWSFLSLPAGSTASLTSPTTASPRFVADCPGEYRIRLIVRDRQDASRPLVITIIVVEEGDNRPPVAFAGFDRRAPVLQPVQLDGSRSFDPDGDPLAFEWIMLAQPNGSAVFLPDGATTTFTPLVTGIYQALLVVRDDRGGTSSDLVTITAVTPTANITPVVVAGPDQLVSIGNVVNLNGGGSFDPEGGPLSFQWELVNRPQNSFAPLALANTPTPLFTPDVPGDYLMQLTVRDLRGGSGSATVKVTAVPAGENIPPVAVITAEQVVVVGSVVLIIGSGSHDLDRDGLTFDWTLLTPAGSRAGLSGSSVPDPSFTPDVVGDYHLQLRVNDGRGGSDNASITIAAR